MSEIGVRIRFADDFVLDVLESQSPMPARGVEVCIDETWTDAKRISIRNTAYPRVGNDLPTENPVEIKEVVALLPDTHTIFLHELTQASPSFPHQGMTAWRLWSRYGEKVPCLSVPHLTQHHVLRGGETVSWDVVKSTSPTPPIQSATPYDDRIREFLQSSDIVKRELIGWSNLKRLRETFDWTDSQLKHQGLTDAQKDAGWYLAQYWQRRWDSYGQVPAGNPIHIAKPDNWMTIGSLFWASGHSNGHYDFALWCIDNHLNSEDRNNESIFLAYVHSIHKLTRGLIRPDHDPTDWRKERVYLKDWFEKGQTRPGDAFGGKGTVWDSHQWKIGTLCAALLTGDKHLIDICAQVGEQLLKYDPTRHWNRAYGIRSVAWSLYNLVGYGLILDDARYFAHARDVVHNTVTKLTPEEQADPKFWPNQGSWNGKGQDGWQDCIFNYWALRALEYANDTASTAYQVVSAMADHYATNCVRLIPTSVGRFAQIVEGGETNDSSTWQWTHTPTKLAYCFPLIAKLALKDPSNANLKEKWEELADSAFNGFMHNSAGASGDLVNHPDEINWTNASLGPAVTKVLAGISMGGRPDLLPGGSN